jgi:DNA-binding transcriptional ArsR family regulator
MHIIVNRMTYYVRFFTNKIIIDMRIACLVSFNHMVDYTLGLNDIFGSLSDPTRRDILSRVATGELSVGDIASSYNLSLAAISKHLKILERAQLIVKQRRGKQQMVIAHPIAFKQASDYLQYYEDIWDQRFDALELLLSKED